MHSLVTAVGDLVTMSGKEKSSKPAEGSSTPSGESSGSSSTDPSAVVVTNEHFAKLMEAIQATQSRLDNKLAEFKAELSESQERAATSAARKVQAKQDSFVFKKKSHEEQHKANITRR